MTDEMVELSFSIPLSKIEEIKKYAEARGVPVAEYVIAAINQSMNFDTEHYDSDNYRAQKIRNEVLITEFLEQTENNKKSVTEMDNKD